MHNQLRPIAHLQDVLGSGNIRAIEVYTVLARKHFERLLACGEGAKSKSEIYATQKVRTGYCVLTADVAQKNALHV